MSGVNIASAIEDKTTYLLAVCTNLALVQRGEILLDCRISVCSIVHKDLQSRKLAIMVRSVLQNTREVSNNT